MLPLVFSFLHRLQDAQVKILLVHLRVLQFALFVTEVFPYFLQEKSAHRLFEYVRRMSNLILC